MDYDKDGILDLIGGHFGGFVFLARGTTKGKGLFELPTTLNDAKGAPHSAGEFWDTAKKSWGGDKTQAHVLGIYPLMFDWDSDGDRDLVWGGYRGKLLLMKNEGTSKEAKFSPKRAFVRVEKKALEVSGGCSPAIADWNQDGVWDLLVADSAGVIRLYENAGTSKEPHFKKERTFVLARRELSYVKMATGDLNGDGAPDLVYGGKSSKTSTQLWVIYGKKSSGR